MSTKGQVFGYKWLGKQTKRPDRGFGREYGALQRDIGSGKKSGKIERP